MIDFIGYFLSVAEAAPRAPATGYPSFQKIPTGGAPITQVGSTVGVLVKIINFAQGVFWILAAGFALYGAYLYLFSGGSKESVASAKKMMIYTVVASLLAILAYGIPAIVYNFISS